VTVPAGARDQPLIAIDVVPVAFADDDGLLVASARRRYDPYIGLEALPGVLLDGTELLEHAAYRALESKAGIPAAAVRHLAQIGAFDGPDRDPRSTAISVAFLAVVDPGAGDVTWHGAGSELGLAFDHDRIVAAALDSTRTRLWSDVPRTRALLGEVFPTSAAARLERDLTGAAPDAGNLNRSLRTNPLLVRADDVPAPTGRSGRPPAQWRWVTEQR
jgi:8-oxo-dGTP diphosphatase